MTTDAAALVLSEPRQHTLSAYTDVSKFELMQRVAKMFSESQLIPTTFQKNVPNCIIALEIADRLQASPLMVMQNLNIIHGKPSFGSSFLIGGINSCGRFQPLRFDIHGEGDERTCIAWSFERTSLRDPDLRDKIYKCATLTHARDTKLPVLESAPVSIGIAKKEGWWSRKDKYGNEASKWQTMPDLMLRYRAATWFSRMYAPDVAMGMKTSEEYYDYDIEADAVPMPEPPPPEPVPKKKGVTGAKAARAEKVVEPEQPKPAEPELAPVEPITPPPPPPAEEPEPAAPVEPPTPAEEPKPAEPELPAATTLLDDRCEIASVVEVPTNNGRVVWLTGFKGGKVTDRAYYDGEREDIPAIGAIVDLKLEPRINKKKPNAPVVYVIAGIRHVG